MMNHLGRMSLSRTASRLSTRVSVRPLATSLFARSPASAGESSQGGGFGEKERKEHRKTTPYDQAPYQNEYTRSGTHDEVSKSADAFDGSNTDPETSRQKHDGALDGSGANEEWSKNYRPGKSNKNERDHTEPSEIKRTGKSASDNGGQSQTGEANSAQSKFDKLEREGTEDRRYQGYSIDKRK